MKWSDFDLSWGRPLKSILASFNKKRLNFEFHHLSSSNTTFTDKEFERIKEFLLVSKIIIIFSKNKIL